MPTPLEYMLRYRSLNVEAPVNDPVSRTCRTFTCRVELRTYFMMNWTAGTEEFRDYTAVTSGGERTNEWYMTHREAIRTAAMGKGAPEHYERALEWAIRSGKILNPSQATVQQFCDEHLGIDCSGFVTNYLIAIGKKPDNHTTRRNTNARMYYNAPRAVNSSTDVCPGDLLVWMTEQNAVKTNPGHIAVVQTYTAASRVGGNMRVVEATGAAGATPKLLDSMYSVEQIIDRGRGVPVMILVVRRHGVSGSRVCVIRP